DATGANVNMDLFPVKMAQLPNKPAAYYPNANGEQFTPEEFLRFVRTHLNIFTKDENGNPLSTFTPINTDEQILWNSNKPLTAVIHIDIPLNDGSVICSKYNDTEWYFTTLTAPFPVEEDGTHPVSGNRAFGIKTNNDGSYSIYTRGVDRMRYRSLEFLAELNPFMDSPFDPADNLWNAFQERLVDFINDNSFPGNASK